MTGGLRAYGPTVLVPAAWLYTYAAVTGGIEERTAFIGLSVMTLLLGAFFFTTIEAMQATVLELWQRVLVGGLVMNGVGLGAWLGVLDDGLLVFPLFAWLVFPGVAYVLTWRAVDRTPLRHAYLAGGAASFLGTGGVVLGGVTGPVGTGGLLVVGAGQTLGILAAAYQNAN